MLDKTQETKPTDTLIMENTSLATAALRIMSANLYAEPAAHIPNDPPKRPR